MRRLSAYCEIGYAAYGGTVLAGPDAAWETIFAGLDAPHPDMRKDFLGLRPMPRRSSRAAKIARLPAEVLKLLIYSLFSKQFKLYGQLTERK